MRKPEYDPSKIEYWKRIFPNKSEKDLEQMKKKWGNAKPLEFPKL